MANWDFAPITGAWIETDETRRSHHSHCFAPITGAWIETLRHLAFIDHNVSHLSQVRGLKQYHLHAALALAVRTYHRCVD